MQISAQTSSFSKDTSHTGLKVHSTPYLEKEMVWRKRKQEKALFIKKKKKKDFFIHNLTAHGVKLITCVKHFIFWQGSSNLAEGYSPFFVSRDFHVRFLMMLIIFLSKFECVTKHSRKHRILFYPVAVRGVTLTHAFF